MHFILISKKDSFKDEQINEHLLNSSDAPSLISREAIKFEISNFIIYIYPYDHIDHEVYGYSYFADEDRLLLVNGIVNVNNDLRNPDISVFFDQLNDSTEFFGDYQIISIDKEGNGFIRTPPLSVRQLFHYEDENCDVISTEIKLIVDGIQKFREKPFVHHYDYDFIEDSVFREWTPRDFPRNTIFKEIKRIFPQDTKYFKKGKILIERKESIEIPQWFRDSYNNNKHKLFDDYYDSLINFVEANLVSLKPNFEKITLGLTGGLDSRLTAAILSPICKKQGISFECSTSGQDTHPDVVIAKKVAKVLNVKHFHVVPQNNKRPNTNEYKDYALTFYMAQGDWNSKDFVIGYTRKISNFSVIAQLGMDAFKRYTIDKICSGNRWFARRILFHKNFFFPLFFTEYETWFALLYAEHGDENAFKEFVYEILQRSEPKLLTIPFAGDSLPQTDVKPHLTKLDSTYHQKDPFLWDYGYVNENLKQVLRNKFNELDKFDRNIIKVIGLNELDYFINEEISKIINLYHEKQINLIECFKELLNERFSADKYYRKGNMITMTKENRYPYLNKMQILMDFAAAAKYYSFQEMEKDLSLRK
ncbi:hypothetical protein [Methanobacterium subterraneum]|uniref:Asparagine synthetase domain-containing protein n=1 Tax=Methanobacterium subterraneum TaxID=59277 RepID=A0A7K4DKB8_9EURY|nr:hypothetical protein [Methanobacterium subterraneum]NMO08466.1 hypothetical protein [Methanobacterium subterraneum]